MINSDNEIENKALLRIPSSNKFKTDKIQSQKINNHDCPSANILKYSRSYLYMYI